MQKFIFSDETESGTTTHDDNIVDSGKLPIIIISDDDDIVDTTDVVCNVNDSQNVVEESSHDLSQGVCTWFYMFVVVTLILRMEYPLCCAI